MKNILSMLLASVMVLSLAACSNQPAEENSSSQSSSEQTASLETTYPVTITDALGREVTIEEEPERLVERATTSPLPPWLPWTWMRSWWASRPRLTPVSSTSWLLRNCPAFPNVGSLQAVQPRNLRIHRA